MIGTTTISKALVVLGTCLLVGPALVPVQPVLYHDTGPGTGASGAELEAQGYDVVAYENLSKRGQELYVAALERRSGEYTTSLGEGAPDFEYPTVRQIRQRAGSGDGPPTHGIVIERPPESTLPPADEPVYRVGPGFDEPAPPGSTEPTADQTREVTREQIRRYDLVVTTKEPPPAGHRSNLLRLLSAAVGIVFVGLGGYLHSQP